MLCDYIPDTMLWEEYVGYVAYWAKPTGGIPLLKKIRIKFHGKDQVLSQGRWLPEAPAAPETYLIHSVRLNPDCVQDH